MEYLIHDHFKNIIDDIREWKLNHPELEFVELGELSTPRRVVWGIADSIIIIRSQIDNKENPANNETILALVELRPSFDRYQREYKMLEKLIEVFGKRAEWQEKSIKPENKFYPSPVESPLLHLFRKPSRKMIKRKLGHYDKPIGNWLPELQDPRWQTDPMLQEWYPKMAAPISTLAKYYFGGRVGAIPTPTEPKQAPPSNPIEIFFSYAHEDEALRDELAKHLSIFQRQGMINAWHDRQIAAGTEWKGQIDEHLTSARIILLLISADFLASDYCYDIEVKRAMERHENGEARIIPIILRPCIWNNALFGKLQALPKDGKPVMSWTNLDEAFTNIAQGIEQVIKEFQAQN